MSTPRSIRLLMLLEHGPEDGMRLQELNTALCESGRNADAATVTMLLDLRQKHRVSYTPPPKGAAHRGGRYAITGEGIAYLARKLESHPDWAEEVEEGELETGAMHGEHRRVLVRTVEECGECVLVVVPNWVFGLAQRPTRVLQSPWNR
jgi:hypothetical protein